MTKIFWNIEVWAVQKHVNLVDLVKSFPTNIFLQNLAPIQKRTSPIKFAHLAEKSEEASISNLSTKQSTAEASGRQMLSRSFCRLDAWMHGHSGTPELPVAAAKQATRTKADLRASPILSLRQTIKNATSSILNYAQLCLLGWGRKKEHKRLNYV